MPSGFRAFELLATISSGLSRAYLNGVKVPGPWWERLSSRGGGLSAGLGDGQAFGMLWNWSFCLPTLSRPLQPLTLLSASGRLLVPLSLWSSPRFLNMGVSVGHLQRGRYSVGKNSLFERLSLRPCLVDQLCGMAGELTLYLHPLAHPPPFSLL